jgi:hypothetical protein
VRGAELSEAGTSGRNLLHACATLAPQRRPALPRITCSRASTRRAARGTRRCCRRLRAWTVRPLGLAHLHRTSLLRALALHARCLLQLLRRARQPSRAVMRCSRPPSACALGAARGRALLGPPLPALAWATEPPERLRAPRPRAPEAARAWAHSPVRCHSAGRRYLSRSPPAAPCACGWKREEGDRDETVLPVGEEEGRQGNTQRGERIRARWRRWRGWRSSTARRVDFVCSRRWR